MEPIDRHEYEEFKNRMEDEHKRMNVRLKMAEETGKQIHQLSISSSKRACGADRTTGIPRRREVACRYRPRCNSSGGHNHRIHLHADWSELSC